MIGSAGFARSVGVRNTNTQATERATYVQIDFFLSNFLVCLRYFSCVIEYVPSNCFIKTFRTAISVLVGPRCLALLDCMM